MTNPNMECYSKCQRLYIAGPHDNQDCSCTGAQHKCTMSYLIDKINDSNNFHVLRWFKRILSNVDRLFVPNKWSCIFDHIPMSWIFDKHNYNKNKNISIIGSSDGDGNLESRVVEAFSRQFSYISIVFEYLVSCL